MPTTRSGNVTRTVRVPSTTVLWSPWTPCEIDRRGHRVACRNLSPDGAPTILVDLTVEPVVGAAEQRGMADGAPLLLDSTDLFDLAGARVASHEIPDADLWSSSWWSMAAAADGVYVHVTQARGGPQASVELYDQRAGVRRWQVGLDRLRGYPMGFGIAPDGTTVAVIVRPLDGDGPETLIAFDGVDGRERWRQAIAEPGRLTPSPVMFAPDGHELLRLGRVRGAGADGRDAAVLVAIAPSDGHELRRVMLPASAVLESPSVSTPASWGYDGEVVWFHHHRPERTSDHALNLGPGHTVAAACSYEVYDAHRALPRALRTAADVPGELGEALRACRVLSLRPLADRGVAVIGLSFDGVVSISLLDGPP